MTVVYRKYRPQTFGEIVGQDHIVTLLQAAIKEGRVGHGYLFIGPRGTGKTTTARILAKTLNCKKPLTKGKLPEPCDVCDTCLAIKNGAFFDLIELDAASHRGIDEVRSLKETIRISFSPDTWKVIILDEAHSLTKDAANALLKTLEEPPARTVFILITTEAEKILPTIKSRLQILPFKNLGIHDIVKRLNQISQKENVHIDENVLKIIALNAAGSLRDAESSLAKVLALGKPTITIEDVRDTLGIVDEHLAMRFIGHLIKNDANETLDFIKGLQEKGIDIKPFLKTVLEYLRKVLMICISPATEKELQNYLTKEDVSIIIKQANQLQKDDILRLIEILLQALQDVEKYPIATMGLEVAVIKVLTNQRPTTND